MAQQRCSAGRTVGLSAIDVPVAQGDGGSASCSSTLRTARMGTSGANVFVVLLIVGPSSYESGPPTIPVRSVQGMSATPQRRFPR